MSQPLKNGLCIHSGPVVPHQKNAIQQEVENWCQDLGQTDDICIVGFGK